jgi:hypothetical protein
MITFLAGILSSSSAISSGSSGSRKNIQAYAEFSADEA